MSLANAHRTVAAPPGQHEIHRCEFCGGHYPEEYGFNRRFCRRQCKYRNIAKARLDDVRFDHRYCFSCFRKLKEVEPPGLTKKSAERGKSIPDCATGRQSYYEHCRPDLRNTRYAPDIPDGRVASPDLRPRMTCSCPANHHTTAHELPADVEWTKREAIQHTKRLVDALDELEARGVHTTAFDADTLFGFVRKAKSCPSEPCVLG
jgi:hypothetical protein